MASLRHAVAVISLCWLATATGQKLEVQVARKVDDGIANWEKKSNVTVTPAARDKLLQDVAAAQATVRQRKPSINEDTLNAAAPRAVVDFLERSNGNKESADLAAVLEQSVSGTGVGLQVLTEYPTLEIDVTPPRPADFVVSIDGKPYAAGRSKFRVREGDASVAVARAGKQTCFKKLRVTAAGPNLVSCVL